MRIFVICFLPFLAARTFDVTSMKPEEEVEIFFGVGCFWHVQHAFIKLEQTLLGRHDKDLTALVGYAGGSRSSSDGRVCYHNWRGIADYDDLGHAEAVQVSVPREHVAAFFRLYFSLFVNGERADYQDVGAEYRSILGIPFGMDSELLRDVEIANQKERANQKLVRGRGSDPDTLGKRTVFVYDSNKFRFHQGELYHQFHDDMLEKYSANYHNLQGVLVKSSKLKSTGCPE